MRRFRMWLAGQIAPDWCVLVVRDSETVKVDVRQKNADLNEDAMQAAMSKLRAMSSLAIRAKAAAEGDE